jgi:SAM-dependent methyltransferase
VTEDKEVAASADNYRGLITDRGLTRDLNRKDGVLAIGSLDMLGLTLADVEGHKVLDVGIGGGRSLRQAMELGLDYSGIDILPLIDADQLASRIQQANVKTRQAELAAVVAKYPDRFRAADFANDEPPWPPNSFDMVISAGALPGYSRDAREVVHSLLNMITLARERVVCGNGWFEETNPDGIINLGRAELAFRFRMKDFLESLAEYGINYSLRPGMVPAKAGGGNRVMCLDLDVSSKDSAKLAETMPDLLAHADEFSAAGQPPEERK